MNHKAMKIIGSTIGMLSIVAVALVAVLAVNTSTTDAQDRYLTESSVEVLYLTSSNHGNAGDDGQRVIETTNERIAQGFWVGQGCKGRRENVPRGRLDRRIRAVENCTAWRLSWG